MMTLSHDERKAAWILFAIAAAEGTWCLANVMAGGTTRLFDYLGFIHGGAGAAAWILGIVVAALFAGYALRIPSVRANAFRPSLLKVLGLAVAVTAGICEEAIFRKLLMNSMSHSGYGVALQVIASALAFGVAHGVWGAFRGSFVAAGGAMLATGILGGMLAVVFIVGHRVLAPCVISHFVINAMIEPGLVLAAVRGELGRQLRSASVIG